MHPLRGKRIWIIGASSGIGAALADHAASLGALVAASARDTQALSQVTTRLPGVGHIAIPLDVTQEGAFTRAADAIRQHWPRIDIVLYNAGIYLPMDSDNFSLKSVHAMLDTNLRGAFSMLETILPLFTTQGSGHLAFTGSIAGFRGLPGTIGYGSSKAGIINLAETLRPDLQRKNIKVQIVNPGFVKTRLIEGRKFPRLLMISPEEAAHIIAEGLTQPAFEIHFPKRLTWPLKFLGLLPDPVYFFLAKFFI